MLNKLINKIKHCKTKSEINQSFDHISIFTKLLLRIVTTSIVFRKLWKSINVEKIREMKKKISSIKNSKTKNQINESIKKLQNYLIEIINKTVSWAKTSSESKSFWFRNCFEAIFEFRKLRRKWTKNHLKENWQEYVKSNDKKKKTIKKVKQMKFRKNIVEIISENEIWKLVKWAKEKNQLSKEISRLSKLRLNDVVATTFEEKVQMFKNSFFSSALNANLSDINDFTYAKSLKLTKIINKEKVNKAIAKLKTDKTSETNQIFNRMLKTLRETMTKKLTLIFQICINVEYHSKSFREAKIIMFKKIKKSDYIFFKVYRLIALLNTMNKILKSIMINKITELTKKNSLLSKSQMSAKRKKEIETTLKLLTKEIHAIWKQDRNKVIIIMNVNVTKVYDHVSHIKLLHNLRKKKISNWIIQWIKSFLKERRSSIIFEEKTSTISRINAEISQEFSVSFILYLFFNANLLDVCEQSKRKTTVIEFVDNVNVLTYSISTEKNCKIFEKLHEVFTT